MKKQNKLEALFPNGKVPDVNEFNRNLDKMSKEGRNHLREKIYKIAFTVWSTLPKNTRSSSKKSSSMIVNHT